MNLIYHSAIQNLDAEQRQKFDDQLAAASLPRVVHVVRGREVRAPSWWRGEEVATRDSLAAARQLGFAVPEGVT